MSEAVEILKEIEKKTKKQFLPIIGPHKGKTLEEVIRDIKPNRVLEVGTLIGYSAILMAKELDSKAHLITIEIHEDEAEIARENIRRAKMAPKVDVITGDAKQVIPTLKGKFDMVFIDAEKSEYMEYMRLVEPKLHTGSVVVADNAGIFADDMKDYLDHVRSSGKYTSKYISYGEDGVEVSVRL
jgi:predicted O-methyltransferase YrrM